MANSSIHSDRYWDLVIANNNIKVAMHELDVQLLSLSTDLLVLDNSF